jgi:MOSC domain-containing protein YiiM
VVPGWSPGLLTGRIHQISISNGGVPKLAIESADIGLRGVVGDYQADRKNHGSPEQALCVWSLEVIEALQAEGHPIQPGFAGENITVAGIDWTLVVPGTTLLFGDTVVAPVTADATPCASNADWFKDRNFRRMSHIRHPGWSRMYTSVTAGGSIRVGDPVRLLTN